MKKILHIVSSPRGGDSYSNRLADAIIENIRSANPGSTVKTVDLSNQHFPHLEEAHLASFFTPADKHSAREREAVRHSEEAIAEIREADILVIGAPMWNFSIPSALKAWIDHVVRAGITFRYDEKGVEGLVKGKKVYIAVSSGGVFSDASMKHMDFVEPYLRHILGFIGLTDISFFRVEGLSVPGVRETALNQSVEVP